MRQPGRGSRGAVGAGRQTGAVRWPGLSLCHRPPCRSAAASAPRAPGVPRAVPTLPDRSHVAAAAPAASSASRSLFLCFRLTATTPIYFRSLKPFNFFILVLNFHCSISLYLTISLPYLIIPPKHKQQ